jgi:DNA-binding protein YbaB
MDDDLQAPLRRIAEQAREQIAALRQAQQQAEELIVPAGSSDGLVRVEIGARGELRAVRLDDRVFESMPPRQLAQLITRLAREAAAEAARRVREALEPAMPVRVKPGSDPATWLQGVKGPASGTQ